MGIKTEEIQSFADFPLSQKTQLGLKKAGYFKPTEIQRQSIGLGLQGCDILGAAKTGSGKTVAFLVPVLEKLDREKWTKLDGLGALIITPTRELAYQIFEVLKKIGGRHDFSAGLIIGGKDLKFETERMDRCSIIICTPGRILHHMDENPAFTAENLQILVLDEADRILDLGFEKTMNAIIDNLPVDRQTVLFSATQTKSVKDLARLSLKDPQYISVHEHAQYSTPEGLRQIYMVCELHEKIDTLWSFIKTHKKQKILVFFASCKQVKYAYEIFCRMRPGMTVMSLYGTLHQLRRMAIYDDFCRKQNAVLFATDIAARGLDFPSVHWVVQMDCPEDVNTYIHRAGRTARFERDGQSLLVLMPSEESFAQQLQERKIPIQKIAVNPMKQTSVIRKMEALCACDVNLKASAQRAFMAYMKSVFYMKDKKVFDVMKLDPAAYARSLGLAMPPRIRFLQKKGLMPQQPHQNVMMPKLDSQGSDSNDSDRPNSYLHPSKVAYDFCKEESEDSGDDFLKVKSTIYPTVEDKDDKGIEEEFEYQSRKSKNLSKAAIAKKLMKKKIKPNQKIVFNDEGEEIESFPREQKSQLAKELVKKVEDEGGINLEVAKQIMLEEDKIDKQLYRERVKAMHQTKRFKKKAEKNKLMGRPDKERRDKVQDSEEESENEAVSALIDALPDPDKVYSEEPKRDDDNEEESGDNDEQESSESGGRDDQDSSESEEAAVVTDKRKNSNKQLSNKKQKLEVDDTLAGLDTGLSLEDDEELALRFLSRKQQKN